MNLHPTIFVHEHVYVHVHELIIVLMAPAEKTKVYSATRHRGSLASDRFEQIFQPVEFDFIQNAQHLPQLPVGESFSG